MTLHRCTEAQCPYLGQRSPTTGCACHKTDEQVLRETLRALYKAVEDRGGAYGLRLAQALDDALAALGGRP